MPNITIPSLPLQIVATDLDIMVIVNSGLTSTNKITRQSLLNNIVLPLDTEIFQLQRATNTISGGNARGSGAIDIQTKRTNAIQVASGINSVVVGTNSRASGQSSVALGTGNIASGADSFSVGEGNTASASRSTSLGWNTLSSGTAALSAGRLSQSTTAYSSALGNESRGGAEASLVSGHQGQSNNKNSIVMGGGGFAAIGDAQNSLQITKGTTSVGSGGTFTLLNGGSNIILLGTNRTYQIICNWVGNCHISAGGGSDPIVGDTIGETQILTFKKVGGTTSQVGTTHIIHTNNDASMSGATLTTSIVSNNVSFIFTAPTTTGSNTYRVVATLYVSEIG